MALYADALKKYQNFLGGTDTQRLNTATDPSGLNTATQPAPGGASSEPTKTAPSVPTSTNAEQTDFRSYDQNPGAFEQSRMDPYADLAAGTSDHQPGSYADVEGAGGKGMAEAGLIEGEPYQPSQDELVEQALADLLAGQRDTAEEEQMIRDRTQADMLQGVVDNQARMGAMGFGASGALAGLDADIRGRASLDATDQIMGLRQDARDDWLRRVGTGLGADLTRREYASREASRDAYADLLRELTGEGADGAGDALGDEGGGLVPGSSGPREDLGMVGSADQAREMGYTELLGDEMYETTDASGTAFRVIPARNPETGEVINIVAPANSTEG